MEGSRFTLPGIVPGVLIAMPVAHAQVMASRVEVHEAERKLLVYAGDRLLATYPVVLGGSPIGHKRQEGDRKTPEGDYLLDRMNPRSGYHLSPRDEMEDD